MRNILIYLFTKSISKVDMLIVVISAVLVINKKYAEGFLLLILGGLIVTIIEGLLGI